MGLRGRGSRRRGRVGSSHKRSGRGRRSVGGFDDEVEDEKEERKDENEEDDVVYGRM